MTSIAEVFSVQEELMCFVCFPLSLCEGGQKLQLLSLLYLKDVILLLPHLRAPNALKQLLIISIRLVQCRGQHHLSKYEEVRF